MIDSKVIKKLPSNIKILWADCYWFQYTENKQDDQYLISKEIADKILRQDINRYLMVDKK